MTQPWQLNDNSVTIRRMDGQGYERGNAISTARTRGEIAPVMERQEKRYRKHGPMALPPVGRPL